MLTFKRSLYAIVGMTSGILHLGACSLASDCTGQNADFEVTEVRIDLKKLVSVEENQSLFSEGFAEPQEDKSKADQTELQRAYAEINELKDKLQKCKQELANLRVRKDMATAVATVKLKSNDEKNTKKQLILAANDKLETLDVRLFNAEGVLRPSLFFQWRVVAESEVSTNAQNGGKQAANEGTPTSEEGAEISSETDNKNDIAGALSKMKDASNKLSRSLGRETEFQVTFKSDSSEKENALKQLAHAVKSSEEKCLNVVCAEDVSQAIYQQAIKPWEVFYSVVEGDDTSFLRQWVQIANFTAYSWNEKVNVTLSNLGADNVIESKSFSLDHRLEADNAAIKVVEHMEIRQHEYSIDLDSTYRKDGNQAKAISKEFLILKERPAFLPVGNYREDFRFEAYSRDVNREGRSDNRLNLGDEPKTYAIFDVKPTDLPPRPLRIFAGFVELLEFQQFNIDLYHDDVHRRSLGSVSLSKQRSAGWNLEDSGWNKITRNGSIFYTRSISSPSPLQKINLTESKISRIDFNKSKDNEEDFAKLEKASKTLDSSVPSDVKSAIRELIDAQNGINRNKKRAGDLEAQAGELGKKYDTINLGTDSDANASRRDQLRVIWEAQQELLRTKAQLEIENARLEGVIDSILFPFVSNP